MKNKSLGVTSEEKYGSMDIQPNDADKKLYYPEMDLCAAQIDRIDGAKELDTDDIVTMSIKARVSRTSSDEKGKKVTLEVEEINDLVIESEEDETEDTETEDMETEKEKPKTDRFGRKLPSKLSPKEAGMKTGKSLNIIIGKLKSGE